MSNKVDLSQFKQQSSETPVTDNQAKDNIIDSIIGNLPTGLSAIGRPTPAEDDFVGQADAIKAEAIQKNESLKALEARQKELERNIEELRKGQGGIKASGEARPAPKPIDWTKVSEQDAYGFEVPIEAVSYDIPSYMDVELANKNFEPRWVNVNPARMGPMRVVGFIPVEEKDLAKPLALEIGKDGNGHYRYIDVILMKVPKSRYFAALKSNFLRSIMLTDQKKLHEINQAKMGEYVESLGPRAAADWKYAQQEGANHKPKMEVYI